MKSPAKLKDEVKRWVYKFFVNIIDLDILSRGVLKFKERQISVFLVKKCKA